MGKKQTPMSVLEIIAFYLPLTIYIAVDFFYWLLTEKVFNILCLCVILTGWAVIYVGLRDYDLDDNSRSFKAIFSCLIHFGSFIAMGAIFKNASDFDIFRYSQICIVALLVLAALKYHRNKHEHYKKLYEDLAKKQVEGANNPNSTKHI